MTKKSKLLESLFNNPKNIHFSDLDSILTDLGYKKRQSKGGGSHYIYSHPDSKIIIVLVSHSRNDLLPEYQVKKAIQSLKNLMEEI